MVLIFGHKLNRIYNIKHSVLMLLVFWSYSTVHWDINCVIHNRTTAVTAVLTMIDGLLCSCQVTTYLINIEASRNGCQYGIINKKQLEEKVYFL